MPGEMATYASQTVYPLTLLGRGGSPPALMGRGSPPALTGLGDAPSPPGGDIRPSWPTTLSPISSRKDSATASSSNASSDSSPPSPGSSKAADGAVPTFLDVVPFPYPPRRNVFIEPGSGMRDVPMWLKSLRLHKYTSLFQQISYDEMLGLDEVTLEAQGVTKGARHKIVVCVGKLGERPALLKSLEREAGEPAHLRATLSELKAIVCTPIRPFPPPGRPEPYQARIDGIDIPPEELDDENLPAHFTRVLGKLATGIFSALGSGAIPDGGDDLFPLLLHVLDRVLNHEAFTQAQKRRVLNWKQVVKRVWNPVRRPSAMPTGFGSYRSPWPAKNGGGHHRLGHPPSRPRWSQQPSPNGRHAFSHHHPTQQPPTIDPTFAQKQKHLAASANWHQLQTLFGYLTHGLPSLCHQDKAPYHYDKGPAPGPAQFRSVQDMATALAAYNGLVHSFSGGPCHGACRQGPVAPVRCDPPPPPPPASHLPPTHPPQSRATMPGVDWSSEEERGGKWSVGGSLGTYAGSVGGKTGTESEPSGSGWGERPPSPAAFHFVGGTWGGTERGTESPTVRPKSGAPTGSTLSSRMDELCRSVAEVALVEQITAAAAAANPAAPTNPF